MTTPDQDERIFGLLGELKAGLDAIREDMREVKDDAKRDRRDSKESRQRIYEKAEDSERRLTSMESTVRVLGGIIDKSGQRLDALEPKVERVNSTIKVWSVRGGIITTALVAFGGTILWLVQSNAPFLWDTLLKLIRGQP